MSKTKRGPKGGIDLQSVQVSAPGSAAAAVHEDLPPMPERDVLDRQLQDVMESMNIPQTKMQELMDQSDEKKWQLVWGQMKTKAKFSPEHYLNQLISHIEALEKQKKKKAKSRKIPQGVEDAASILRGIEISLRTNSLSWVQEFVNFQPPYDEKDKSKTRRKGGLHILMDYFTLLDEETREVDDNYLCVLCLRALMNNAFGFTSVMAHPDSINQICLCLTVDPFKAVDSSAATTNQARTYRTHILVLELLAAVCLVPKGHPRILQAFDNFQKVNNERQRFLSLLHMLRSERHNVGVTVACMAFINVVVHCVPDMNYQVALQEEFTQLGLMPLIEELAKNAPPDLAEQIDAYQDNFLNVAELAREAEARVLDLRRIEELKMDLETEKERGRAEAARFTEQLAQLHKEMSEDKYQLEQITQRLDDERATSEARISQLTLELSAAQQELKEAQERIAENETELEDVRNETELLRRHSEELSMQQSLSTADAVHQAAALQQQRVRVSTHNIGVQAEEKAILEADAADASAQAPPPPPPPPPVLEAPPAPPPPDAFGANSLRKPIMVDVRLPMLNWSALPQSKVGDTVFSQVNDEEVLKEVDFGAFKSAFRLDDNPGRKRLGTETQQTLTARRPKGPSTVLDLNRARNLAIAQRRVGTDVEEVVRAINELDFRVLPAEKAEQLGNEFVPNADELKLLTEAHASGKPMADIDDFLLRLSRVPRIQQRLSLMSHLDSCEELLQNVSPQTATVIAASNCLMSSKRLRQLLSVILAYGNYMNSHRRGCASGFKLSVFDRLLDTRTRDRDANLMHFIAETLENNYPEALRFMDDMVGLEPASKVSLQALELDIVALERTMRAVVEELEHDPEHPTLVNFRDTQFARIDQARQDYNQAKAKFVKVTTYFAEERASEPSSFFSMFLRLSQALEKAQQENVERKERERLARKEAARFAAEQRAMLEDDVQGPPAEARMSRASGIGLRSEVGDGDIDVIISSMKTNAFRRPGIEAKISEKREIGQHEHFSTYATSRPWLK